MRKSGYVSLRALCLSLTGLVVVSGAAAEDPEEDEVSLFPPTVEESESAIPAAEGLLVTEGENQVPTPRPVDITKPALFLALGLGADDSTGCSRKYLLKYNELVNQFLYANGASGEFRTFVPGSKTEAEKTRILSDISELGTSWAGCLKGEFPGYEGEISPDPLGGP